MTAELRIHQTYCDGRGTANGDHCCYLEGKVCPFLRDNGTPGPGRFRCGLREDLGSWEAVHADAGYQKIVQPVWDRVGIESCGAWQPAPGRCCREAR